MTARGTVADPPARLGSRPTKPKPTKIGEKLRVARLGSSWSLQELAEAVGVSPSYLSKVESGRVQEPSGGVLVRLARVFNWTTDELHDCFVTEEEAMLDARIEERIRELEGVSAARPLIQGRNVIAGDLKGKKVFLTMLEALTKLKEP